MNNCPEVLLRLYRRRLSWRSWLSEGRLTVDSGQDHIFETSSLRKDRFLNAEQCKISLLRTSSLLLESSSLHFVETSPNYRILRQ